MKPSTLTLSALLTLAGCTALTPQYKERPVDAVLADATLAQETRPDALPALSDTAAPDTNVWWSRFDDPALTRLLAKAYAANRTLEAARANLRAAQAAWEYQQGALWPSVDLGGDLTRQRTSENGLGGKNRYTDYRVAGSARWELDLFGRQQLLADAAEAEAQATEADLKAMWISVSTAVATYYVELRTLQGRLMVAEDNLKLQQANYDLQSDRSAYGLANDLIKNQAEYDLRNTAATIPSLKAQVVAAENSLAILCGVTPGSLPEELVAATPPPAPVHVDGASEGQPDEELHAQGLRPTQIPQSEAISFEAGIPIEALRRRPDVFAAERRLKAAVDLLGSAEAERYPNLYLSASVGLDSLKFSDLFDWDSHFYNFGPGVTLPIFHGGQIVANIEIKTEQQKAALAAYENTVLTALGDIRSALSGYTEEQKRLTQLRLGVQAAQAAYEIATDKHSAGLGSFFDVLDSQRQLFALDEARVISEGQIAQNQVRLYKALCGGWDGSEEPETADALFGERAEPEPLLGLIAPSPVRTLPGEATEPPVEPAPEAEEAAATPAPEAPEVPVEAAPEVSEETPAPEVEAIEAPAEVAPEAPVEAPELELETAPTE